MDPEVDSTALSHLEGSGVVEGSGVADMCSGKKH